MSTCGASKPGGGTCQNKTSGGRCWRHKNVPMDDVAKATKPKVTKLKSAKAKPETTKSKATKPKSAKATKPKSAKATKPKAGKSASLKFVEYGFLVGECIKNGKVVGVHFGKMVKETPTKIKVIMYSQKENNLTKWKDVTLRVVSPHAYGVGDIYIKKDGTWTKYPECKFRPVSEEDFFDMWEYEVQ